MSTPDIERWRRVSALFDAALELDGDERAAFLARECPDAQLRAEVESLLCADDRTGVLDHGPRSIARSMEPEPADAGLIGKSVGPWRIERMLGRGGMGAVFLAARADGAYTQSVALKLIATGLDHTSTRERFVRERQFLASLRHPNISALLDGGVMPDGTPYFAMELVNGRPIDLYCDGHRLTIVQRLKLMLQVLGAVQHAHQRLIVHRDLKPSNILVGEDGTAKLVDFGIATVLDASGAAAATRDRPFTPAYAAPEQLDDQPVTTATDVYALGMILLELLSGYTPQPNPLAGGRARVETKTAPSLTAWVRSAADAEAIAAARDTSPRALVRQLHGDLDTIVQRALAHEPSRRYASAQALATDIELWLAGRPVNARPDSWWYRTSSFVRRHRLAVALSTTAVLALIASTAFSLQQASAARAAAREAEARALSLRAVNDTFNSLLQAKNFRADADGPATPARLAQSVVYAIKYFLADQPVARAALLWTSGRDLRISGDARGAAETLRASAQAFAQAGQGMSLDARAATLELARAQIDAGDGVAATAVLDGLERSLKPDEVNVDLQHHGIALLRAQALFNAGKLDDAASQINAALVLAPAPSGEHGARYGKTALLAGTIRLAQGSVMGAGDRFAEALEAMAADSYNSELAPPQQPLAPALETMARLGDIATARDYAARWQGLRERYFGKGSTQAREASVLEERLAQPIASTPDATRAERLRKAFAAYWAAKFIDDDITRGVLQLDRDP